MKNPILKQDLTAESSNRVVSRKGVYSKTFIMLSLVIMSSLVSVLLFAGDLEANRGAMMTTFWVAIAIALISSLVIIFKPLHARAYGALYAISEGVLLGILSILTLKLSGGHVVLIAIVATFAIAIATFTFFASGVVKMKRGGKFYNVIAIVMTGSFLFYLILLVGTLFGMNTSFLYDGSPLAIGLSVLMLIFASLSFFNDYMLIEDYIEKGAGEEYEWFLAVGLVMTIVWVYIEALRLVRNLMP